MLFTFILSIIAGAATPYAEPHIQKALKGVTLTDIPMEEGEFRTFSFIAMMLAVSILLVLADSDASPFVVVLGGGLGLFGKRILDRVRGGNA